VCLPVLARLHVPGQGRQGRKARRQAPAASTVTTAAALVTKLAAVFPGRMVHVVADAHYHGPALRDLPEQVTWTTRLPRNAVLYQLAPPRVRKPGRPPRKGPRLGTWAAVAAAASWAPAAVRVYGRDQGEDLAEVTCLWYGCLDVRTVRVILARDTAATLALVTTDLAASAAALIERYAARWSIEQAFADARNILGAGDARNRVRRAVERTVPFAMLVHTLVIIWYARHGYDPADIEDRRQAEPWYPAKAGPAFEDMLTKLRRVMICARISGSSPARPEPRQIIAVLAAWHAAAA
jgi:transposase